MQDNISKKQHFFYRESIQDVKGECLEYKSYPVYPFKKEDHKAIQRSVCGMLNLKGGRIFIGITDEQTVEGVPLTPKQKDEFKNNLFHSLIEKFEPSLTSPKKLYEIFFLPIQYPGQEQFVEDRYVIKIIVKQGDTSELYSTDKNISDCYKRVDAEDLKLSFKEVKDEITQRMRNPQQPLPLNCFIDPKPLTTPVEICPLSTNKTQTPIQTPTFVSKNTEIIVCNVLIPNISYYYAEEEFSFLKELFEGNFHSIHEMKLYKNCQNETSQIWVKLKEEREATMMIGIFNLKKIPSSQGVFSAQWMNPKKSIEVIEDSVPLYN